MRRSVAWLTAAAIVIACRTETPPSDQPSVRQQAVVVAGAGQPDSARAFVQRFYAWYLTTKDGEGYDSVLTSRRGVLGDSLFRAFQADVAAQRRSPGEIDSYSGDVDVFLNSQDPCEHYATQGVSAAGPGVFAVTVAGDCGDDRRPNIEVYVRQTATGWQIENIKDPTNPSYDLLRELVQYHLSDPAVPDSVGSDWLTYQGDGFTVRYPKDATLARGESHPSGMPGMAIQGPKIHIPVPTGASSPDGPAYRLVLSSFPNPRGSSPEQWVDSLRREVNGGPDADSLAHLGAPDTVVVGTVRALRLQPFCGDCAPFELYVATSHRMIVASYVFDVGTPGFRDAQERFYQAVVSTLRPSE